MRSLIDLTGILFFLLLNTQIVLAISEDHYLLQLEAEADEIIEDSNELNDTIENDVDLSIVDEKLILNKKELINNMAGFEKALENNFSESYNLYLLLSYEKKRLIYDDFIQNKRLKYSSVKIISLYLESH
jgi:hypothetical protein